MRTNLREQDTKWLLQNSKSLCFHSYPSLTYSFPLLTNSFPPFTDSFPPLAKSFLPQHKIRGNKLVEVKSGSVCVSATDVNNSESFSDRDKCLKKNE